MKILYIVIALVAVALIGLLVFTGAKPAAGGPQTASPLGTTTAPANGATYVIDPAQSTVSFAGSKPLIPNYIDSGTIGIQSGTLTVDGTSGSGSIVMDMNTVNVGSTAKAGMESALTKHLKESDFFDVANFPTATFTITGVAPHADASTSSLYDISGSLTMKGKTNDVTFPAKIFLQDGKLHAQASLSIDRTKWGITFGSKDFFATIGNNAISNDVKLTLDVVATPQ